MERVNSGLYEAAFQTKNESATFRLHLRYGKDLRDVCILLICGDAADSTIWFAGAYCALFAYRIRLSGGQEPSSATKTPPDFGKRLYSGAAKVP
jgi:hypothetical protein